MKQEKMILNMAGIQESKDGASMCKKSEIDHDVLMKCPRGAEVTVFLWSSRNIAIDQKSPFYMESVQVHT